MIDENWKTKVASQSLGKKIPPDGIYFSLMLWGRIPDIPAGPVVTFGFKAVHKLSCSLAQLPFAAHAYGTQQCYRTLADE